jgi:hypothetical protein
MFIGSITGLALAPKVSLSLTEEHGSRAQLQLHSLSSNSSHMNHLALFLAVARVL